MPARNHVPRTYVPRSYRGPRVYAQPVAPVAPGNVTPTAVSQVSIALVWSDTNGGAATYKIERSSDGVAYTQIAQTAAASYADSGLAADTPYYYRIRASVVGDGPYCDPVSQTTWAVPAAPSNLVAVAGAYNSVTLTWADNSTTEAGFELQRGTDGATFPTSTTYPANTVTTQDLTVSGATTYYYRVRATSPGGSSAFSNVCPVTTPAAPAASAVQVDNADAGYSETGSWSAQTFPSPYYGADLRMAGTNASTATWVLTGLISGVTYTVQVDYAGYHNFGTASYSVYDGTTLSFTATADQTVTPTDAVANGVSWKTLGTITPTGTTVKVVLTGTTATSGLDAMADSARVVPPHPAPTIATPAAINPSPVTGTSGSLSVLGADAGGEATLSYTWTVVAKPSGVTAPTFSANGSNLAKASTATFAGAGSYTLRCTVANPFNGTATSDVSFAVSQTPSGLAVSPTSVSLLNGATQQFTAAVVDQFGAAISAPAVTWSVTSTGAGGTITTGGLYTAPASGAPTDTIHAASGSQSATATVSIASATLGAPSGLGATGGSQQVSLSWTASTGATGTVTYLVEQSADGGTTWAQVGSTTAVSYTDTGLLYSTLYTYRVRGHDTTGYSLYSATASGTTNAAPPGVPSAPTNLVAVAVDSTSNHLFWDGVSQTETSITVRRKAGAGSWQTAAVLGAGENCYPDPSCYPGITYTYQIFASNGNGASNLSNTSAATTAGPNTLGPNDPTNPAVSALSATTALFTFADNAGAGYHQNLIERRPATAAAYQVVRSVGGGNAFTDVGLAPGATYFYRTRALSTSASQPSNYTAEASVTMPARTAGYPVEPSNLTAVTAGPTSLAVAWADNDGNCQFEVSYALWNASHNNPFTVAGLTGAATYTVTGLAAETPYFVRVRAKNGTGYSDYAVPLQEEQLKSAGAQVAVCTSSPSAGGTTYNIGPGQTYTTPGAFFNAVTPGPGDVVNIYPTMSGSSVVPYTDAILISSRGTPSAWVQIVGQPDPTYGAYPVLDFSAATATTAYAARATATGAYTLGGLWIGRRAGMTYGYNPGYLSISNLTVTNAYPSGTVTVSGVGHTWSEGSAGIYVEMCEHLTLADITSYGNGNGIFGATHSDYDRFFTDYAQTGCYIHGNSGTTPTGTPSHNTYVEAVRATYEANQYGPIRAGGQGIGLKDRSCGTVIRYNFVSGGNGQIQCAEAQNGSDLAFAMSTYNSPHIYGNITYAEPGNGPAPVWVGGDQGNTQLERKGPVYIYHNTSVSKNDQAGGSPSVYRMDWANTSSRVCLVDARNNIWTIIPNITNSPSATGIMSTRDNSLSTDGHLYVGVNWVPKNYSLNSNGTGITGSMAGVGPAGRVSAANNLLVGAGTDPGMVNVGAGDYHLNAATQCVGSAGPLPAAITSTYPVNKQYHSPQSTVTRTTATDVGAYQQGVV